MNLKYQRVWLPGLMLVLALSLGVNAAQAISGRAVRRQLSMERQRDMTDVVRAMADIEMNLEKLLIASGAAQNVALLGKTALLAQHVETGLSRLPLDAKAATGAMRFAGQMGDYAMTLAEQVSGGGNLTADDERQIEGMLTACQGLNNHLLSVGGRLYDEPMLPAEDGESSWQDEAIAGGGDYPPLVYDGALSDAKTGVQPKGLTGERVTREQARNLAARYAGTDADRVTDAADSGGVFEAFGFAADTASGAISVQVTGQGGHLLWMMPEQAEYAQRISMEVCMENAVRWLEEMGFTGMECCFTQRYDGMAVMDFAAVQEGVLLYPDRVKVQVSMETGAVVGAECSQYLMNHAPRAELVPSFSVGEAQESLSSRLDVSYNRLCVIPAEGGERLCWQFVGTYDGVQYYAYIDAHTGEPCDILRIDEEQGSRETV